MFFFDCSLTLDRISQVLLVAHSPRRAIAMMTLLSLVSTPVIKVFKAGFLHFSTNQLSKRKSLRKARIVPLLMLFYERKRNALC